MNNETIVRCTQCKKEVLAIDAIKLYDIIFCNECHERLNKTFNKPITDTIDHIYFPAANKEHCLNDNAYYDMLGGIIIYNNKEDIIETIEAISHETLHFIIHKVQGFDATYLFDNIAHDKTLPKLICEGVEVE